LIIFVRQVCQVWHICVASPEGNTVNRSLLLKFVSIGLIAVLILIPLLMIEFKISERAQLRQQAEQSVARSWTGAQQVSGPMIAIDYERSIKINPNDAAGFHYRST